MTSNLDLAHDIGRAIGREDHFQELMASQMIDTHAKTQILAHWQSQYQRRAVPTSAGMLATMEQNALAAQAMILENDVSRNN